MSGRVAPRLTIPEIRASKHRRPRRPLAMLTAADAPTARLADEAGADIILVGDSLAMVALGYETTLSVTMDEMIHHARAVCRARPRAVVIGDMPYLSYHLSVGEAVRNAGRFVAEAGCAGVKIEGGLKRLPVIAAIQDAEIPVMGHVGLTPQSCHVMGGYRFQARTAEAAERLVEEARCLDEAGVFCIVLEGIPAEVARIVTSQVSVPTIGIGAGPDCDGQVLVMHDVLGLTWGETPRFVRRYADFATDGARALARFVEDVRAGRFPAEAECYELPEDEAARLRERWEAGGGGPGTSPPATRSRRAGGEE
jgi:3-methyl-2-oxobutanoate hydroxymethyltransferase